MNISAQTWRMPVRVDDIPAAGQCFELVADAATRTALASAAGLSALPRLAATFDVTRHGRNGLHVTGIVSATVQQTCVISLEPVESDLEEAVDLTFVPPAGRDHSGAHGDGKQESVQGGGDAPEVLVNGTVDLGAITIEFLMIGIDPYPRKPGAEFAAPVADEPSGQPFAALAAMSKRGGSD
jgi:uncharacterized metal-binding protein YceD (DUF177 family)